MFVVLQGVAGAADSRPPPPLGPADRLHRAYQETPVPILEPQVNSLCPSNYEVSPNNISLEYAVGNVFDSMQSRPISDTV